MKKFLFIAAVSALAFFAGSCQRENLEPVQQGGTTVTYTVNVPDAIATKADDGVTKLIYEVYRAAEVDDLSKDPIYEGEATLTSGTASLELEFVKNQNFKVLFWAQDPDVTAYVTEDLRAVTLTTSLTANDADLAVFAGSDDVVDCVSNAGGNVSLVRPVSQINIATSPESLKVGTETSFTEVGLVTSSATVKNGLYQVYNVADKTVSEAKDFEYTSAAVPAGTITVGTKEYTYVAMNYVGFAPETGATVDVDFTIVTSEGDIEHSVSSVPVKPNYKTNLTGNLITASDNYVITLNDTWGTPDTNVEVVAVSTAQDLQEAIDNIQPGAEGNIILEGNIDFGALAGLVSTKAGAPTYGLLIPAGKALVLDLNGCTISQTVNQTGNYSMIQNDGNLTILDSKGNGKITYIDSGNGGNYISNTITNRGTLTVKSGSVENNSSEAMADVGFAYAIDSSIWGDAAETVTNIEGGTVKSVYSPLRVRADSQTENVIANISGGEIYGRIDHQMSSSEAGVKGTLNISGGTFIPYGIKSDAAIMVFGAGQETDASGIVLNVAGGTFQVPITIYRGDYVPLGQGFNEKFITGGTFKYDPTANLADGYITVKENGNYVVYKAVAEIGETKYKSLEEAIAAAEAEATITVLCDAEMAGNAKIDAGKTVVIDLNGYTISAVDNTEKNYQIIQNNGNLTIKNLAENTAKMTVKATINSGWNRYSAVIANTVGGILTVERNVVLEHLGGTDMAYGIDNLTNGKGTSAVTTINGATVKSPYRAVRQFLNGIEATNELYVKAGSELRGDNKSIFFHDPSKNANTGKLVVEEGARLYGDVYLFVTAGSTEWPVEVSIAASALADASEVLSGNVPSGYAIIKDNETWKVVDNAIATAEEFKAFRNKINAGEKFSDKTAYLVADIDLNGEEWIPIGTKNNHFHGTFDGQGHTISNFKITQKHDGDNAQAALFGTVSLTTVFKNFNIDNIQVLYPADYNGDYYGAAVIGTFYGKVTLQNINVTKSTIQGNNKVAGLIAHDGSSSKVLIENCNVNGCTIETKNEEDGGNVGGLVGLFQNTEATVKNCSVTGCTINAINSSDSGKRGNALLIGGTIDATPANLYVKIDNCKVADNTFNETGRVNYVSPYGDGTLVGGAREGDSYVIGKVEIDGVVYPNN